MNTNTPPIRSPRRAMGISSGINQPPPSRSSAVDSPNAAAGRGSDGGGAVGSSNSVGIGSSSVEEGRQQSGGFSGGGGWAHGRAGMVNEIRGGKDFDLLPYVVDYLQRIGFVSAARDISELRGIPCESDGRPKGVVAVDDGKNVKIWKYYVFAVLVALCSKKDALLLVWMYRWISFAVVVRVLECLRCSHGGRGFRSECVCRAVHIE